MSMEIGSIHSNNTWTLAKFPPGHKAITCRWVFKVKEGVDNGPPIKKARLVARGFQQQERKVLQKPLRPSSNGRPFAWQ
jgi:hypothetical protein